jgi:hypothetical protein
MPRNNTNLRLVDAAQVSDVANEVMNRKSNNPFTFDRRFREMFGCSAAVVAITWNYIERVIGWTGLKGYRSRKIDHLLWALMFLKVYGKEATLSSLFGGVDEKTYRKWVWLYVEAVSSLESFVVSTLLMSLFNLYSY